MNIIQTPSPNFNSRENHAIDMLVLHYTGMRSGAAALDRLCQAEAKVSAHYLVEEDGRIFQLVAEEHRAWHAGVSYWRGHTNINQRSIGIEIVNPGHDYGYRDFPKAQMEAVTELCQAIVKRHPIPARNVVAHSDIAPVRKQDPGELFDWKGLASQYIGLWPSIAAIPSHYDAPEHKLHYYGYDINDIPSTITAFQRHFRPQLLSAIWDGECEAILQALLKVADENSDLPYTFIQETSLALKDEVITPFIFTEPKPEK